MARWQNRPSGSNWGDFGAEDQRGRMNLLTPARRLTAVREVREGIVFSLSLPLDYPGGVGLWETREPPRLTATRFANGQPAYPHRVSQQLPRATDVFCDDAVTLCLQYSTQWDALAHCGSEFDADGDGVREAVFYNGYRAGADIVGPDEPGGPCARALGIENLARAGVQGRGVLVDLYSEYGRTGAGVGYEALMRLMEVQRVRVEDGDFLCLYTGLADLVLEMRKQPDRATLHRSCAALDGADERLQRWIAESGIVAICADNAAVESTHMAASTKNGGRGALLPLHELCLFKLGIHLGELWYFRELAHWLRGHSRNRFLLTAPPLDLPGAVGSPVTPLATV
ncbi:MAG TPA: cyclase family protein [Steroidobacteraceae bacterium]|nr:cyclase family protein [Steroidobacteraceae bacterium]